MNGFFNFKDVTRSLKEYELLSEAGSTEHQEKLGIYYWTAADNDNTQKYLSMAARGGSLSAMVMLSMFYVNPPIIDMDTEKFKRDKENSLYWLKKSAELGDRSSMLDLAVKYEKNKKLDTLAFIWYEKASMLGVPEATYRLGSCYKRGYGTQKDLSKAFELFSIAAEYGVPEAMYELAICYRDGISVSQDIDKAIKLFTKASELGDSNSQNELGVYYSDKNNIDNNPYEAFHWFNIASHGTNATAEFNLANCYFYGTGTDVDHKKAYELYQHLTVIINPFAAAYNMLGKCYENGFGINKDIDQAIYWYTQGARSNDPEALESLRRCCESNGKNTYSSFTENTEIKTEYIPRDNTNLALKLFEEPELFEKIIYKRLGRSEEIQMLCYLCQDDPFTQADVLNYIKDRNVQLNGHELPDQTGEAARRELYKLKQYIYNCCQKHLGLTVRCIKPSPDGTDGLILNKLYSVIKAEEDGYIISDEYGEDWRYPADRFTIQSANGMCNGLCTVKYRLALQYLNENKIQEAISASATALAYSYEENILRSECINTFTEAYNRRKTETDRVK